MKNVTLEGFWSMGFGRGLVGAVVVAGGLLAPIVTQAGTPPPLTCTVFHQGTAGGQKLNFTPFGNDQGVLTATVSGGGEEPQVVTYLAKFSGNSPVPRSDGNLKWMAVLSLEGKVPGMLSISGAPIGGHYSISAQVGGVYFAGQCTAAIVNEPCHTRLCPGPNESHSPHRLF